MKNSRKKILQNIQEKDGTYQYTGESFRLKTPITTLVICCILTFLLVVISGTLDTAAAFGAFYVILPYVGEVSALFMLVWNSVSLFYNKDNMRSYILDHVRSRIPGAATVLSLCAMLGMVCSMFYLFRYGSGALSRPAAVHFANRSARNQASITDGCSNPPCPTSQPCRPCTARCRQPSTRPSPWP